MLPGQGGDFQSVFITRVNCKVQQKCGKSGGNVDEMVEMETKWRIDRQNCGLVDKMADM